MTFLAKSATFRPEMSVSLSQRATYGQNKSIIYDILPISGHFDEIPLFPLFSVFSLFSGFSLVLVFSWPHCFRKKPGGPLRTAGMQHRRTCDRVGGGVVPGVVGGGTGGRSVVPHRGTGPGPLITVIPHCRTPGPL